MSRRSRSSSSAPKKPLTLVVIGLALFAASFIHNGFHGPENGLAIAALICIGIGAAEAIRTLLTKRQLPKQQILRLAENRGGILTLSEIITALDIDPARAEKTLKALSQSGLAHQRWQEFRKNIWEFPDLLKLPLTQTIDLAKQNGGRVSLSDLLAAGQSPQIAQQTLDTLSQHGLAHPDPTTLTPSLILTTQ